MTEFQKALIKHLQTPGSELWLYIEQGWTMLIDEDRITLSDNYDIIHVIYPEYIRLWRAWLDDNLYFKGNKLTGIPWFTGLITNYSIGPPETESLREHNKRLKAAIQACAPVVLAAYSDWVRQLPDIYTTSGTTQIQDAANALISVAEIVSAKDPSDGYNEPMTAD